MKNLFYILSRYVPNTTFNAQDVIALANEDRRASVDTLGIQLFSSYWDALSSSLRHLSIMRPHPARPVKITLDESFRLEQAYSIDEFLDLPRHKALETIFDNYDMPLTSRSLRILGKHRACDILRALHIDAVRNESGVFLTNPDIITEIHTQHFSPEITVESTRKKEAEPPLPKTEEELMAHYRIGSRNLSDASEYVAKCKGPDQDIYIKYPGTNDAALEEWVAIQCAADLGTSTCRADLLSWNGTPYVVKSAVKGRLYRYYFPLNSFDRLKINRDLEKLCARQDALDHRDWDRKKNIIVNDEGLNVVDLGYALRYHATGRPKEYKPLQRSNNDYYKLILTAKENATLYTQMEESLPKIQTTLKKSAETIKTNFFSYKFGQNLLMEEVFVPMKEHIKTNAQKARSRQTLFEESRARLAPKRPGIQVPASFIEPNT